MFTILIIKITKLLDKNLSMIHFFLESCYEILFCNGIPIIHQYLQLNNHCNVLTHTIDQV